MNIAELRRLEAKRPWDINDIDAVRNALPELLKALEWQPIETAPHDTNVLLAWEDITLSSGWRMEAGISSWGWRRGGVSNMSAHGQATHWMPLPLPPHGGVDVG